MWIFFFSLGFCEHLGSANVFHQIWKFFSVISSNIFVDPFLFFSRISSKHKLVHLILFHKSLKFCKIFFYLLHLSFKIILSSKPIDIFLQSHTYCWVHLENYSFHLLFIVSVLEYSSGSFSEFWVFLTFAFSFELLFLCWDYLFTETLLPFPLITWTYL